MYVKYAVMNMILLQAILTTVQLQALLLMICLTAGYALFAAHPNHNSALHNDKSRDSSKLESLLI